MKIGLDVGSTTLKCMVYDRQDQPVYQEYERHYSQMPEKASGMLQRIQEKFPEEKHVIPNVVTVIFPPAISAKSFISDINGS